MESTAEVILPEFTEDEARKHTDRIAHKLEELAELIAEAWHRRADKALGYESWQDYCAGEFDTASFALKGQERDDTVLRLRSEGMSTRAIAAATGVGKSTVDRTTSGVPNGTPAGPTTGTDGKTYATRQGRDASAATSDPANTQKPRNEGGREQPSAGSSRQRVEPRNINPDADITPDPERHHVADPVRHQENQRYEAIRDEIDAMTRNLQGNEDFAKTLLVALKLDIDRLMEEL